MSCECYQIGGRFIAEDPDCQVHNLEARDRDEDIQRLQREVEAWRQRFPQYRYRPQDEVVTLI